MLATIPVHDTQGEPPSAEAALDRSSWFMVHRSSLQRVVNLLFLSVISGYLFFYGLNAGELYRTESLRAIIAAEFLRSGNWIVPTLYGEPLFTKPPGMYAAIAALSWPAGGVSEWTARLPSALAATASVFLFYWYFARQLGQRAGMIAALILPLSVMWLDKATAAEIDMVQTAWVTAAILCFLRALEEEEKAEGGRRKADFGCYRTSRPSARWWLAALLCVAGGVLTKWTAPAFFYGTAVPLLWWRGRLRLLWGWRHLASAAVGAALCLGWAGWAVALAGWDVFFDTVSREALQRLSPGHHIRPYPWRESLAHPFLILASTLPWSLCAVWTLRPGFARRWDEHGQLLLQALHCWTWPNLLFWSVIPEHAARHSLPLCPGIAGLAALVWVSWLTGKQRWPLGTRPALGPGRVLAGAVLAWIVVKLVFIQVVIPQRNLNREPRAKAALLATHIPEGKTLYLFRLKDEGIMFYYGRPVRRLAGPRQLPSRSAPLFCILEESEWQQWDASRAAKPVLRLRDEQGAPLVLVEVAG